MCGPNLKRIGVMVGELSQLVLLINNQKQRIERGLAQENHKTNFLALRWSNNENWYNISIKQGLGRNKVRIKIWDFDLVPVCKVNIFCNFSCYAQVQHKATLTKKDPFKKLPISNVWWTFQVNWKGEKSSAFCKIDTLFNYNLGHESKTIWNEL